MKPRWLAHHPVSTGGSCPPEARGGRRQCGWRWEGAVRSGRAESEPEARPSPKQTPVTLAASRHVSQHRALPLWCGVPTAAVPHPAPHPSACCHQLLETVSPGPFLTQRTAVLLLGCHLSPRQLAAPWGQGLSLSLPRSHTPRRAGPESVRVWVFSKPHCLEIPTYSVLIKSFLSEHITPNFKALITRQEGAGSGNRG